MFKFFSFLRRGHAAYTSLALGIFNFLAIQYQLVIANIPWLAKIFPSMWVFSLALAAIYLPLTAWMGWYDFRNGSMKHDIVNSVKANPYSQDMARAIVLLGEGRNQEAAEVMRKWA